MENTTTITDIPRKEGEFDKFGLVAYEKGLETFLRGASTPITVALQGEWGSGKTSLMNVLRANLCGKNNNLDYYSVWINTWEFSLMRDPNEALLQILYKMADKVVKLSKNPQKEAIDSIKKNILRLGLSVTRGIANKMTDGLSDEVIKAFSEEATNSIADLRSKLQEQINNCFKNNKNKKGIIFFIDDLDRIDPPIAVELLELLKNIFTLEHCLFILAIDYDVVIKGLKPKFGELNEKNEREFRSFFDKIIQVPFSMPVSQYSTEKYLIEELIRIEIISTEDSKDEDFSNKLNWAENLTVGHNPRSIKRFLNTLSLIKCISGVRQDIEKANKKEPEKDENIRRLNILLNLSIVGIQVAYPRVYQLLCIEPGFTTWDDRIASKMGIPRIDEQTENRLSEFDEFDETWEKVLYRLCLTDKYLQNNAINISRLLNMIRKEIKEVEPEKDNSEIDIEKASQENGVEGDVSEAKIIRKYMQYQMSQAAVTNYAAGESGPSPFDTAQLIRDVQSKLLEHVSSIWENRTFNTPIVKKIKGGVRTEGNKYVLDIEQQNPESHKICLHFYIRSKQIPQVDCRQFMPEKHPEGYVHEDVSKLKDNIELSKLFSDFFKECKEVELNECFHLWAERCIHPHGKLWFNLFFDVTFDNPDAFLENGSIKIMQDVTRIFFDIIFRLDDF